MKKKTTRHGVRADGKAQTSISLRRELLEAAKEAAEKDNRSLSNWLEILLKEKLEAAKRSTSDQIGEEPS
jgi:hypothetical protein